MARNLFGGTAGDVVEDDTGARVRNAIGTVWDGPDPDLSTQLTDLTTVDDEPVSQLVADDRGFLDQFYGPDGVDTVWVDFGYGRVALVSSNTAARLEEHIAAIDPHGTVSTVTALIGQPNGIAGLDPDGLVPASQLPGSDIATGGSKGICVPAGWGEFWKPKRDAAGAGTGKAVVAAVGSSSFMGLYSSNPVTKGLVGLIAKDLQTTYGDGGSGFYSSIWQRISNSDETTSALDLWEANGVFVGLTGANWEEGGTLIGPGCHYIFTDSPGATITFQVRGTSVIIYTTGKDGGRADWTYTIDGSAPVTVVDNASTGLVVIPTRVNGLTAGDHTVVLTHTGVAGEYFAVCGVAGENNTGVIVNNFGRSGATSSSFTAAGRIKWNGGVDYPADVLIYCVGANDAAAGVTTDAWSKNVRTFLDSVKDGTSTAGVKANGTTDVVIVMQHIGHYDTTNVRYQDYIVRGQGLAAAYGAAFVDLWTIGRNSWNYLNSLNYWGNSTNPSLSGTDDIHMSDLGHQAAASAILPVLKS